NEPARRAEEDGKYRDALHVRENTQKRARRAEDGEYRNALQVQENTQKRARRAEDGEYRDALQVRDVNCKWTARNKKRDRRVDLSKGGFVDEEHTTFALWRATEKGSDDMRDRDENGRHYLGSMDVRCGYCGAIGFRGELKTKGDDGDGNKVQNLTLARCAAQGKRWQDWQHRRLRARRHAENLSIKTIRLILAASLRSLCLLRDYCTCIMYTSSSSRGALAGAQQRLVMPAGINPWVAGYIRHFFHSSGVGAKPQKKPQKRRKRKERRKGKEKKERREEERGAMGSRLIRHEAKKQCGRVSGVRIEPQVAPTFLSLPPSSSLIVAASSSGPDL
ncbi:hypothetical protein THAOC_03241, partial [Thalassiosira oceanica]